MNTDIKQIMAKKTDEQLIKIVTIDRDGYEQIGIDAAEKNIQFIFLIFPRINPQGN